MNARITIQDWQILNGKQRKRNREEAQLSAAIYEFLQAARPRCIYCAVPNAGRRSIIEGRNLKRQGLVAGAADWVFTWRDGSGWIELKTSSGTQSPEQQLFEAACAHLGVKYEIARSVTDVQQILAKWGRL